MAKITLIPDDGKLRVDDTIISFYPNLSNEIDIDLSVVHAIHYDTVTEQGKVEYKVGVEEKQIDSEQSGRLLGKEVGLKLQNAFDSVMNKIETQVAANTSTNKGEARNRISNHKTFNFDANPETGINELESKNIEVATPDPEPKDGITPPVVKQ